MCPLIPRPGHSLSESQFAFPWKCRDGDSEEIRSSRNADLVSVTLKMGTKVWFHFL